MTGLNIPKGKNVRGLFVFCNQCKSKAKPHLTPSAKCNHPIDKQHFKAILTIPGAKSVRTKILSTNLDDAIKEMIDFENELKANSFQTQKTEEKQVIKTHLLLDCVYLYMDFLTNKNVNVYQKKERSHAHVKQVELYIIRFLDSLKINGVNINGFDIRQLNEKHADYFYNYLNKNEMANRTFNRHIDTVSEFFNYLIKNKSYDLVNNFAPNLFPRRRINARIDIVTIKEFKKLLELVGYENGKETLKDGTNKYHYYDWIKQAFELGLFSGRRRDEIINMTFSDIVEENGKPLYIKTEDYKYNLRNNLKREEEKKFIIVPVIKDLHLFLQKIGYEKYKGTSRYLIAPDSERTRATLKDDMSKSFTHYYNQLKTGKQLSFKHLRKTYITLLNNYTNGHADIITGHSGQGIIMKNYHDKKVFNEVVNDFSMVS